MSPKSSTTAQAPTPTVRVSVTTRNGTTLQISNPIYEIEQSSTAPGYVIGRGPYVTSKTGMQYLPFEFSWGEALIPFHLLKSISREKPTDITDRRLRIELIDGSIIRCLFSSIVDYRKLVGTAAVGPVSLDFKDIIQFVFESSGTTSRTVSIPRGRPSGPFIVTCGTDTINLSKISASVWWDGNYVQGISLMEVEMKIGQLSFAPDFAQITSIDLTFPGSANSPSSYLLEVTLRTGEKLIDKGQGKYNMVKLLGTSSSIGIILVNLSDKPIHLVRAN